MVGDDVELLGDRLGVALEEAEDLLGALEALEADGGRVPVGVVGVGRERELRVEQVEPERVGMGRGDDLLEVDQSYMITPRRFLPSCMSVKAWLMSSSV